MNLPFSQSMGTMVAPTWTATEAVAVYVYAGTMTSSPGPMPRILRVISAQAVFEFRQTAFFVPQRRATWRSSSFVLGPVVIQPDFKASTTSLISASVMSGGLKGIFLCSILFPCCRLILPCGVIGGDYILYLKEKFFLLVGKGCIHESHELVKELVLVEGHGLSDEDPVAGGL